jgi:hypothetical protein
MFLSDGSAGSGQQVEFPIVLIETGSSFIEPVAISNEKLWASDSHVFIPFRGIDGRSNSGFFRKNCKSVSFEFDFLRVNRMDAILSSSVDM